ncbi:MAG: metallophosphoesterase [Bacillota bacterium]
MKFYHLSDLHYCSKSTFDGDAWAHPTHANQVNFRMSEEIVRQTFDKLLQDDEIDTYLITGDMCNVSDPESRNELIALFREIEAKGKKIYCFPASHDISNPGWGFRFDKDGNRVPNMNTTPEEEVEQAYLDFGYNKAIAQYPKTYSYVVQLDDNLRYIALRPEYGDMATYYDMFFSPEYMKWIEEVATKAKEDGCMMLAGVHYPIVTPSLVYTLIGGDNCFINDKEKIVDKLSSLGINLLLSGHTHINDIARVKTSNGATFNQITTSSLSGYPPLYRKINLDVEKQIVDIKTIDVGVITSPLGSFDMMARNKENLTNYVHYLLDEGEKDPTIFSLIGGVMEEYTTTVKRLSWVFKRIIKFINNFTFGQMGDFLQKESGLMPEDYAEIHDKKALSLLIEVGLSIFDGEQKVPLDSIEHKLLMASGAAIDSMLSKIKVDIKSVLNGNSVSTMLASALYDEEPTNYDTIIDLNNPYPKREYHGTYISKKGIGSLLKIICYILFAKYK